MKAMRISYKLTILEDRGIMNFGENTNSRSWEETTSQRKNSAGKGQKVRDKPSRVHVSRRSIGSNMIRNTVTIITKQLFHDMPAIKIKWYMWKIFIICNTSTTGQGGRIKIWTLMLKFSITGSSSKRSWDLKIVNCESLSVVNKSSKWGEKMNASRVRS